MNCSIISAIDTTIPSTQLVNKNFTSVSCFNNVPKNLPKGSLILLDLDDTLFYHGKHIGSKKWREYLLQHVSQKVHDEITYYVAKNYPTRPLEASTVEQVREWQKDHLVFGFTARERALWYYTPIADVDKLTVAQLQQTGIDFTKTEVPAPYSYLQELPECFQNIFFVDTDTKGEYIDKMFAKSQALPPNTLFIDDKEKQVTGVLQALTARGLENMCVHYSLADSLDFDPLIANIQCYYLMNEKRLLSDEEARTIAHEVPHLDARAYLNAITSLLQTKT